jgi:TolA-binding protein
MASSYQTQLDQLQAQLDDLATSMRLAYKVGNTQALNLFRAQFKQLSVQAAALRQQLNAADQPPALLQQLDAFSDKAITLANEVGADASDLAKGVTTTVKWLPVLVVLALVVLGVGLYRQSLKVRVSR